ncbi:retrovirus-related pol polyprotein from transposon TNT 1-94 [Tanacetum coccineum]
MDLFGLVTPRSINHEKYTLVIVDEYSRYTWVYFLKKKSQALETIMIFIKRVKNQNDIKVKELRTDNAFKVFNTRRQQSKEIYHITIDESPDAIKFTKPSVDNINIVESERYPPDEYLHPYEPSQSSSRQMVSGQHIELFNIIGDPGARMLTRAIAKELNAASAHECLFVDFLSEEEPKKVYEALKHPVWIDAILKAIRIFLAFVPYMNFIVYQMDVKSAFLNVDIVYVYDYSCISVSAILRIAMSLAEAEYVAAVGCCANILWMKSQLTNYDIIYKKVPIFCDNTSAIAILNNPLLHSRTKHIDIRYHFIRYHILKRDIELHFIPSQYQLADIFTKPLDEPTFKRLIVELVMLNIDSKPEASVLFEEN